MKFPFIILLFPLYVFSQEIFYIDFNSQQYSSKSAKTVGEVEPEYFILSINSDSIRIDSKGNCEKLNFKLIVDSCCVIESLQYYQVDSSIIYFHLVETDFDAAGSKIIKFDLNKNEEIWSNRAGGFNAHNFIIYNDGIYLNAIGFLGKINKETGKYFWKNDELYEKYKANHFENVIIRNGFIEGIVYRSYDEKWKLIFSEKTGELVKIQKNGV